MCEDVKGPQRREEELLEEKTLVREFKRSPGSTRAAAGVCVTKIEGGGREKNPQRRDEEVLERRKF